ncbi:MAG: hypothetical protein Q9212_003229 [Teloschistes hypoglaucus]
MQQRPNTPLLRHPSLLYEYGTLAYNITAVDSEPYESNIGIGMLEGQGADCFVQESNGEGATAILAGDLYVQSSGGIEGCESNKEWQSFNPDCVAKIIMM